MLAALVLVSACGSDPIPEYQPPPAELEPPQAQRERPLDHVATEAEDGQAVSVEAETPRWIDGRLIVELSHLALIYPMPGLSWQALEELPAGTQLLIDGRWGCCGEWLRVDLGRGDSAWLRLRDSGLSLQEAESLPERRPPFHRVRLRWDRIAVDLGVREPGHSFYVENADLSHWLVGRSADARRVAIRVLNVDESYYMIWVNADSAEFDQPLESLPIYIDECCTLVLPEQLAIAEITEHSARVSLRPHGRYDGYQLKGGDGEQFPIIGRSVDGQWLALRVNLLSQGYVWIPADRPTLNVAVSEIPHLHRQRHGGAIQQPW